MTAFRGAFVAQAVSEAISSDQRGANRMSQIIEAKSAFLASVKRHMNNGFYIQIGHGVAGYAIVLTPLAFGRTFAHLLYGVVAVNIWALLKEFVIDVATKGQAFRNSVEDYRNYMLGAVIATLVGLAAITRI